MITFSSTLLFPQSALQSNDRVDHPPSLWVRVLRWNTCIHPTLQPNGCCRRSWSSLHTSGRLLLGTCSSFFSVRVKSVVGRVANTLISKPYLAHLKKFSPRRVRIKFPIRKQRRPLLHTGGRHQRFQRRHFR